MNDEEVVKFDDYWRTIARNEDYLRQWGHNPRPAAWREKWHQDLEDAYSQVRPLLVPVTKLRMFHNLPSELDPFQAENYHHALTLLLNPPEQWFGDVGVLQSPEYRAIKHETVEEERSLAQAPLSAVFESLNETARNILEAMDLNVPRSWEELAPRAGYSSDKVRQYSTRLQKAGLIKKTPRGFIRLVPLPEKCDSQ